MTEKQIQYALIGISVVTLIITIKMAMGLQEASDKVNKITSDVDKSFIGQAIKQFGW